MAARTKLDLRPSHSPDRFETDEASGSSYKLPPKVFHDSRTDHGMKASRCWQSVKLNTFHKGWNRLDKRQAGRNDSFTPHA